jgi:hypothetical protein
VALGAGKVKRTDGTELLASGSLRVGGASREVEVGVMGWEYAVGKEGAGGRIRLQPYSFTDSRDLGRNFWIWDGESEG